MVADLNPPLDNGTPRSDGTASETQLFNGDGLGIYRPETPWRPFPALGMSVVVILASLLVLTLTAGLALWASGHGGILNRTLGGVNPAGPTVIALLLPAMLASQITAAWLTWMLAGQQRGQRRAVLSLWRPAGGPLRWMLIVVGFVLASYALAIAINGLSGASGAEDTKQLLPLVTTAAWPVALVVITLGAAVSEELLFRGFLFSALARSRVGVVGAALITSAVWAAIHSYSWQGILTIFCMGLLLSFMLVRTGSLWLTIAAHATFNACSFAILVFIAWSGTPLP